MHDLLYCMCFLGYWIGYVMRTDPAQDLIIALRQVRISQESRFCSKHDVHVQQ